MTHTRGEYGVAVPKESEEKTRCIGSLSTAGVTLASLRLLDVRVGGGSLSPSDTPKEQVVTTGQTGRILKIRITVLGLFTLQDTK